MGNKTADFFSVAIVISVIIMVLSYISSPSEKRFCAYIEWCEQNKKDTFSYYGMVTIKGNKLKSIILNDTTYTEEYFISGGVFKSDTTVVIDKKHCYYYVEKLMDGNCGSDKEMEDYRNNPPQQDPDDRN